MSSSGPAKEILQVANRKELKETGGGHNQKGVNFQRHWAVMRMFELEQSGAADFLLLFESIQDIAELDSSSDNPTSIRIYQIKKKDRNEWSWKELTGLSQPIPGQMQLFFAPQQLSKVKESLLGKLYASVIEIQNIASEGHFVSNSGCHLPLLDGGVAATSLPCKLSSLSAEHLTLLKKGLETLHALGMPPPDLSRLNITRVDLPPNDPGTYVIGLASKFLSSRSPGHAGQASALVESLITKVSPLGARTDTCNDFQEMCQKRGFSRDDFTRALLDLEDIPDLLSYLDPWFLQLTAEGMSFSDTTQIRVAMTRILKN